MKLINFEKPEEKISAFCASRNKAISVENAQYPRNNIIVGYNNVKYLIEFLFFSDLSIEHIVLIILGKPLKSN